MQAFYTNLNSHNLVKNIHFKRADHSNNTRIHISFVNAFATLILLLLIAGGVTSFIALPSLYNQFHQPTQIQYSVLSQSQGDDIPPIVFENTTNLTNNPRDSVYGQVAAWNNHVYVLWQDSIPSDNRNYDIFIKNSVDNGTTFGQPINLSNNSGFSEHPQLTVYGDNVYAVWADNTFGDRQVLFTRSLDNGRSFEGIKSLSKNTSDSLNQEIAAFGANVYVVWVNQDNDNSANILLRASNDGGKTFGETINISNNANEQTFPKIATDGSSVYITWNVEEDDLIGRVNNGLFFVSSSDSGNTFGNITKLNRDDNFGEAQVSVVNDTVYVVWGGLPSREVNGLQLIKSTDAGISFSDPEMVDVNGTIEHPTNVEIAASDPSFSYVAVQSSVLDNEEILLLELADNTSPRVLNLSNNAKISECPSIALAGDNVYVVWEDLTPGNHEILYGRGMST